MSHLPGADDGSAVRSRCNGDMVGGEGWGRQGERHSKQRDLDTRRGVVHDSATFFEAYEAAV